MIYSLSAAHNVHDALVGLDRLSMHFDIDAILLHQVF